MTPTVHAEISADGSTLVLLAQGLDHEISALSRHIPELTPLIKNTIPPGGVQMALTWPAVVQVQATYGQIWQPGPALCDWIEDQIRRRTLVTHELIGPVPVHLTPRPYQVTAAAMIREVGSVLLFDDPGTGKSVSTILGLSDRACARHPVLPVVVVCPASVVEHWVRHFRDWCPRWRVTAWRGSPERRRRLVHTADVYITSYETARRDAGGTKEKFRPLLDVEAASVVADECHRMKSQASAQSLAVRRIAHRAHDFIALSGTPITHSPGDLWPTLNAMDHLAYPSRERWVPRYCLFERRDYDVVALGLRESAEPEFRLTLLGQNRRVSKADVASDLPPKVYVPRFVDLPPAHRRAYTQMEQDMLAVLPDGQELSVMDVLSQMNRLVQLASAAADVNTEDRWHEGRDGQLGEWRTHTKVTLKEPSWKVDELMEVMAERPGRPVVAFAPSRQLMMLAGARAKREGYRTGYIVGGQSARERTSNVDAFQAGELDLICVTTGAGGVGITLTKSDVCVFLQRPWSLVEALQSEDRLHRIGAEGHESIEVIDIIARNTIESRIREVLRERAGQLSELVQDPRIVAELLGGASVTKLVRRAS